MRFVQLIRRFWSVLRAEGWRAALDKTRIFLGMHWRGIGPSAHGPGGTAPGVQPDAGYFLPLWRDLARQRAFHISQPPALLRRRRHIALIGDLNLPQCRKYRVEQWAQFWRARQVELTYAHYQDVPRAGRILQQATHLMEYRLPQSPLTQMYRYEARRLRLPVLYDIDDPLFSIAAYAAYGNFDQFDPSQQAHFLAQAPGYLAMMNGADVLSVSTPGLAAEAAQLCPRPVHLRRNFADAETLQAGAAALANTPARAAGFTLAFASGSQGRAADLAVMGPALADFLRADPARRLEVLGHLEKDALPPDLAPQIQRSPFASYPQYLQALARADAVILPLGDDPFNRCKSAVRLLDAAAVALPVIASDLGDLGAVLRENETGLLVRDPGDWGAALAQLASDPARAAALGRAARADLETRWQGGSGDHVVAPELIRWVED